MKSLIKKFIFCFIVTLLAGMFNFEFVEATPVKIAPHIYVDEVDKSDWFLNGKSDIIFAGCGSPLFRDKKTHYIDYHSIKYGTLKDGRLIITCKSR